MGSNVSRWLGAPQRKTKMTDLAFPVLGGTTCPDADAADAQKGAVAEAVRKDLRDMPWQEFALKSPIFNMLIS